MIRANSDMKTATTALALLCVLVGSSRASDVNPVYKAAPAASPANNFSGLYLGGHFGWTAVQQNGTLTAFPSPGFGAPAVAPINNPPLGYGIRPVAYDLDQDVFSGGTYFGYNWKQSNWLMGIEGDITLLNRNVSNTQGVAGTWTLPRPTDVGQSNLNAKFDWLATLRGRLGYSWNNILLYGTGGVAFTQVRYSAAFARTQLFDGIIGSSSGSVSDRKVGLAVGGGAEWMFGRHWLARVEYIYNRFNDGPTANMPIVGGGCDPAAGCGFSVSGGTLNLHNLRAGIGYVFN